MKGLTLHQLYQKILHYFEKLGIMFLIFMVSGVNAYAMPRSEDLGKQEFAGLKPIADEELSGMRGGFRFSNGVTLDFALKVQSAIDGTLVQNLNLTGNKFKDLDPKDFRTVIQVGQNNYADIPNTRTIKVDDEGNVNTNSYNNHNGGQSYNPQNSQAAVVPQINNVPNVTNIESVLKSVDVNNFPGVLTVIQNSLDNKVIQHMNVLDVNVSNIGQYKLQALTSQINNPALMGLY